MSSSGLDRLASEFTENHGSPALSGDDRWMLATRVAASTTLSRSARLSQLLLYLCEYHLSQSGVPLTEQKIAADVFERRANFDPAADTIVRSHMLRLRQKLETYFNEEGAHETMRITIPRGGYAPAFEFLHPTETTLTPHAVETPQPAAAETIAPPQSQVGRRWLVAINIVLGTLCIVLLVLLLVRTSPQPHSLSSEGFRKHQLWTNLFSANPPTLLVAADSGVVMLHGLTNQNSTLSEYMSRDFHKEINSTTNVPQWVIQDVANRRYTSFVDIELFDRLTHLPEAVPSNYSIRYARDIHANDLKMANVILSGSQDANPWIELFEPQMNFVLQDDLQHSQRAFVNRSPHQGELSLYNSAQYEYGVLAYLPNLSGAGNVLLVEGTSIAGTEAISDFLFEDRKLEPFLEKIAGKDSSLPHFEILLESQSLNGSASQSQIVAYRLH